MREECSAPPPAPWRSAAAQRPKPPASGCPREPQIRGELLELLEALNRRPLPG